MFLVLLGAPGAGKGTQAKVLERELGVPQISTGDMLRASRAAGSELGRRVQAVMDSGGLVSDEIILDLVRERLAQDDARRGAVFDGFPRTVAQAAALGAAVKLDRVVSVEVAEEIIVRRIAGRRSCGNCGAPFHVEYSPTTRSDGMCDKCGGALVQRADDQASAVQTRLDVYRVNTEPLVSYYEQLGMLKRVDGTGEASAVTARIRSVL